MNREHTVDELFSVAGKSVLITGGARGLGAAFARAFLDRGAHVLVTSRKSSEDDANELRDLCDIITADLSRDDDIDRLGREVLDRTDRVDVLVNNAGATWGAPFESYPRSAWTRVLDLDVAAPFKVTQVLLPLLEKASQANPPARVINIGSIDGHAVGRFNNYAYGAAKAGIHHLTRVLALELGGRAITVNCVAPGPVRTKMTETLFEGDTPPLARANPMGRLGEVDDVIGTLLFLASSASNYVTGAVIPVDGGFALSPWGTSELA